MAGPALVGQEPAGSAAQEKAAQQNCPKLDRLLGMVEKTHGLTTQNFLPWQSHFCDRRRGEGDISGIQEGDLTAPVMWGEDPTGRTYVAFRYSFQEKGADSPPYYDSLTFYQAFLDSRKDLAFGVSFGVFKLNPLYNSDLEILAQLLNGATIEKSEYHFKRTYEGLQQTKVTYRIAIAAAGQ